jgi:hypothetical protein
VAERGGFGENDLFRALARRRVGGGLGTKLHAASPEATSGCGYLDLDHCALVPRIVKAPQSPPPRGRLKTSPQGSGTNCGVDSAGSGRTLQP